MSDNDKIDDPAPTVQAAASATEPHPSTQSPGPAVPAAPKRRRWPVLEGANIIIAISTTFAAVASAFAVMATTDNLNDQSALDVLAGFGTSEVVQAKMSLFETAGEIESFGSGGIEKLASFEVAIAPLRNQLTLTALCMGMGRCVEARIIDLFCDSARPLDDVLTAVYAQTAVVPRPTPSAAFTSALARCPLGAS